jgi:hypothetical protein
LKPARPASDLTRRALVAGAAAIAGTPALSGFAAIPRFDIAGAELRWAGRPVRLTGVAVGDPIYIRKGRSTSDYATIALDWHAHVVRISIHPGHWRADPSGAMERLGAEISAARAVGLFAIVDWHAIGFPGRFAEHPNPAWGLPADAYDSDLDLADAFWAEMSVSFGRDAGVIFELWNEPVVDPKLWTSTGQHWPLLKATWLRLLATVRRRSDAIVLVTGGRWAHDLKGVAHDPIEDDRVAYSWHCYPGEAASASELASSLDGLSCLKPVVVTEWGFCPDCARDLRGTPESFGIPFARDVLDRLGLHSTAWCWSPGAAPAMLESDWRTATVFGSFVRRYLGSAALSARSDSRDC